MEEEKKIEEQAEAVELTGDSRRDFVAKLLTAAGAVAVAGLVSESDALAQTGVDVKAYKLQGAEYKISKIEGKVMKLNTGFRFTMSGQGLGQALQQSGLLPPNADLSRAQITFEFSA